MAARIAFVLRSGGEYKPEHVNDLLISIAQHAPQYEAVVLTDSPVLKGVNVIPLVYKWPGWWSKMELMRPDIEGDLLYLDLDTRAVGDLTDIRKVDRLTMLADPYRMDNPRRFGSGVMYLPEAARRAAWESFTRSPERYMFTHLEGGDQSFLIGAWGPPHIARWQDLLPGQLVSYKCDVRGKGVPADARIVYFHGRPRPWDSRVTEL